MARTADDYGRQIQQLLPPGDAFTRDPDTNTGQLAAGFGEELSRLEQRGENLLDEAFPPTTNEMLPDWESLAGLPDPAIPAPVTIPDRVAALCARLLSRGGQTSFEFENLVAGYGYTATIVTHTPFAADISAAEDLLYDDLSRFWWEINVPVPYGTVTPIVALEHAVRRQAAIHTYVTFNYLVGPPPSVGGGSLDFSQSGNPLETVI